MAELLAEFPDGAEQDDPAIEDVEFMGLRLIRMFSSIHSEGRPRKPSSRELGGSLG